VSESGWLARAGGWLRGGLASRRAGSNDAAARESQVEADRLPCAGLWNTPMVQVNGDLTTCCLDEGLENRLGNIRETPLAQLWRGPQVHSWRVAQAEGRYADSGPLCMRCNWRSAGVVQPAEVEAYLERTHERSALDRFRRRR
jgi:radical SAM protein with 4Fe4S-binding SPASM domain